MQRAGCHVQSAAGSTRPLDPRLSIQARHVESGGRRNRDAGLVLSRRRRIAPIARARTDGRSRGSDTAARRLHLRRR